MSITSLSIKSRAGVRLTNQAIYTALIYTALSEMDSQDVKKYPVTNFYRIAVPILRRLISPDCDRWGNRFLWRKTRRFSITGN